MAEEIQGAPSCSVGEVVRLAEERAYKKGFEDAAARVEVLGITPSLLEMLTGKRDRRIFPFTRQEES